MSASNEQQQENKQPKSFQDLTQAEKEQLLQTYAAEDSHDMKLGKHRVHDVQPDHFGGWHIVVFSMLSGLTASLVTFPTVTMLSGRTKASILVWVLIWLICVILTILVS